MLRAFISGFLGALLGGLVVAGWFYFFQPKPYVLDIKSIIDSEKEMILKQVEEKKLSQESAGQRINEFFDSVNEVLSEYRRSGKFILVKDAVLSGGRDITDEFREKLKTEYNKQ
jgi:cbb3-type cytochrome oxidase subunit 3